VPTNSSLSMVSPTNCRCGCARRRRQRFRTHIGLGLRRRHRETNARFERIELIVEFVAGEYEARLDAQHVERQKPHGRQTVRLPRLPHRIPYGAAGIGVTPDLVAEFAGIAGARHHHGAPAMRPMVKRNQPSSASVG
jgi:hypothetical protein